MKDGETRTIETKRYREELEKRNDTVGVMTKQQDREDSAQAGRETWVGEMDTQQGGWRFRTG